MAPRNDTSYAKGVKDVMKLNLPDNRLSRAGFELVGKICNLNKQNLLTATQNEFMQLKDKTEEGVFLCAQKAVHKTLKRLAKHAVSEGNRQIKMYKEGLLLFDPEREMAALSLQKLKKEEVIKHQHHPQTVPRPPKPEAPFRRGIIDLAAKLNPSIHLANSTKNLISKIIQDLAISVANKAASAIKNKPELLPQDINATLPELFGADVAQRATSEGIKSAAIYENGGIRFKPIKRRLLIRSPSTALQMPKLEGNKRKGASKDRRGTSEKSQFDIKPMKNVFKPALRKLLAEVHPNTTLDSAAATLFESVLLDVTKSITAAAAKDEVTLRTKQLRYTTVDKIVGEHLDPELLEHAVAQGSKAIADYMEGTLKYRQPSMRPVNKQMQDLKAIIRSRQKHTLSELKRGSPKGIHKKHHKKVVPVKKPIKNIKVDFTDGIFKLIERINPNMTIGRDATAALNIYLSDICKKVASNSSRSSTSGKPSVVNVEDISNSICRIYPSTMAQYALAEGNRVITISKPASASISDTPNLEHGGVNYDIQEELESNDFMSVPEPLTPEPLEL